MKIFYAGQVGGPFGWGCFGFNMARELGKLGVLTMEELYADIIFTPIADHDLTPALLNAGRFHIGMTFFESELGPNAVENAKLYDVIFAGSSWCMKRLAERGITNTKLLIQGVDESIFHPVPPRQPDGQYRIFSGGKFEYRKGQDLVIAAFREFAKVHPAAHLVCSWFNPWQSLTVDLAHRMGFCPRRTAFNDSDEKYFLAEIMQQQGLRKNQFTILPQLSQAALALAMENTDCGLFPNRCEGGTNLVMMEYAATGREVVANTLTGHADVREAITTTIYAREGANHWAESCVENVVDALCAAYQCRQIPAPNPPAWPWSEPAAIVLQTARELLGAGA